ncbi:FadR/GntR family transcriptional regulator [Anaerosolibacter sp.]|uniref:FadR/GntR family transcriptional regulator n=1 Tax=Anaerosolibacter sp. TaxID=1872527 RepID=UPI0039EDFC78
MFTPIKSKKVYQHVIEQIQVMVMDGTLKKGDKLPAERELAETLGVSRTSIREALRVLEIIGTIESRQGEGNFITASMEKSLFEPLSVMFKIHQGTSLDILELRIIIENEAARIAAERIEQEDMDVLNELIQALAEAKDENESTIIDKEIHYKIAEITGNYLILSVLNAISTLMESFIKEARVRIINWRKERNLLLQQHQEICASIIAKDPDRAYRAMQAHFQSVIDSMKDLETE